MVKFESEDVKKEEIRKKRKFLKKINRENKWKKSGLTQKK